MDKNTRNILNDVNSAISRTRGFYFNAANLYGSILQSEMNEVLK